MSVQVKVDVSQFARMENAFKAAGKRGAVGLMRAVNHTGDKARTAMIRALVPQTGLKRKTIAAALTSNKASTGARGTAVGGSYVIYSRGGNVRLMFFKPRETRKGVSAAPWNRRQVYPGTFMKGGRFPKRVGLNMGGAVLKRAGSARTPLAAAPRSGLFIPTEMTSGASEAAFYGTVERELAPRVAHELYRILGV